MLWASWRSFKENPGSATRTISYGLLKESCFALMASKRSLLMRFLSTAFFATLFDTTIPKREGFFCDAFAFKSSLPSWTLGLLRETARKSRVRLRRFSAGRAIVFMASGVFCLSVSCETKLFCRSWFCCASKIRGFWLSFSFLADTFCS